MEEVMREVKPVTIIEKKEVVNSILTYTMDEGSDIICLVLPEQRIDELVQQFIDTGKMNIRPLNGANGTIAPYAVAKYTNSDNAVWWCKRTTHRHSTITNEPEELVRQTTEDLKEHTYYKAPVEPMPMKADLYVLKIDRPISKEDIDDFKEVWRKNNLYNKAPLIAIPEIWDFKGLDHFGYELALVALKQGYKVQREGWDSYLRLVDGVIYYGTDSRGWIPTQKAILANNWHIVRG